MQHLSRTELDGIAARFGNGVTTARQIVRAHGYERLRTSILACKSRSFHWLLDEIDGECQAQTLQRELTDAAYNRQPLDGLVARYGADMVARELRWLRGTQRSVRDLIYPEPEAAYAVAARSAIDAVEAAHA